MIIFIIFMVLMGISILFRIMKSRKLKNNSPNKDMVKMYVLFGIMVTICCIAVGYFATDTNVGFVYVSACLLLYYLVGIASNRLHDNFFMNLIVIIGLPLLVVLFMNGSKHILINFSFILFPLLINFGIIGYKVDKRHSVRKSVSMALGIGFAIAAMIYFYTLESGNTSIKQEVVAHAFLKQELDIDDAYIDTDQKLRGVKTKVTAYTDSGDIRIDMIYKNNAIVSYEIEKLED